MPTDRLQNPLTAARDAYDLERLGVTFPTLSDCPETPHMALRPFLDHQPECYFDRHIHDLVYSWLGKAQDRDGVTLWSHLAAISPEISNALLFLRQINSEEWHDRRLIEGDDFEVLTLIDRTLHPAYLRLCEAVLTPLLRPIAHFGRMHRGKKPEGLDLHNIAEEIGKTELAPCVASYNGIIRNAIGHGGITYLQSDIRYRDKRGATETLDVWSAVRLIDDMVDTCNGLASALMLFFVTSPRGKHRLPHEFLVQELIEETRSPWWQILGCVESEVAGNGQLLVYARPKSRDRLKVLSACMQSAALAESLAPGYSRYFISLHSPQGWPGWSFFDGEKISGIRANGAKELWEYAPALEEGGFFYVPRPPLPGFLRPLDTYFQSLRLHWPGALRDIRKAFGLMPILGRESEVHRNGWRAVVNGAVVVPGLEGGDAESTVRANKRRIVRAALREARRVSSLTDIGRYLPVGFARISVFDRDFRNRRLSSFGLGPELVGVVTLHRIRRIRELDIIGSTVERSGAWRIAWNAAWLESRGDESPA